MNLLNLTELTKHGSVGGTLGLEESVLSCNSRPRIDGGAVTLGLEEPVLGCNHIPMIDY